MASFSATDAAFEGFRLTKEQPKILLVWAAFNLVISVISLVLMSAFGDSYLQSMTALEEAGAAADPQQTLQLLQNTLMASLPWLVLSLVIQAMLGAAVYRAILRPAEGGIGYLKLGGDEARLVLLSLIYIVLFFLGLVTTIMVAGTITVLVSRALGPAGALVGVGMGLFVTGLIVYVTVRLSLAGVLTFAQRRVSVFGSWALTRGQFWNMTGTYVLTLASVFVVMLLSVIIFVVLAAILTGGNLAAVGAMFSPASSSLSSYLSPLMIAYIVFAALLNAVYYAAIFSPHAVIYRALAGDERAEVFA